MTTDISDTSSTDSTTTDATDGSTDGTDGGDVEGDTASSTATDDGSSETPVATVAGYYASIGIRYEAGYTGLKEMIAYVNEFKDRTTITQFMAKRDEETGKLSGEMTLNMYYVTNTGKDYVPPVFEFMPKGVNNIFGKTIGE